MAPAGAGPVPTAIVPMVEPDAPQNYSMDIEPSYTNGTSNTVSWQKGDDPSGSTPLEYYVEVSRLLGFGTIEMNSGWISANSTTFAGLQDGILYYYRVRARDSLGNTGGFSAATSSSQDDAPPSAPIIGAEPSYTVGTSNSIVWGASVDAGTGGVQYYAEASTSSIFATIAASSGWIGGTSNSFAGLSTATTYYFHVKARDGFGHETAWSETEFSTQDADAPSVPALSSEPTYTAGTSNAISWSASTDSGVGGVQYQVDYSASATFAAGVVTSAWQSGTSFTASPLAGATQYYYRVRARDAFAQTSGNSLVETSTQDNAAPSAPAMTAEPAFTSGTTNAVAWSTSVDATSGGVQYWVDISRTAAFTVIEESTGWISATSFTFSKLDDGVTYFFRVKARDAVLLETAFSASTSSTQDNSPPSTPVLAPEPTFSPGTVNAIIWGASSDAGVGGITYMAELSSSSTFATIDQNSGWTASVFAVFGSLTDGTTYYYRVKARDSFLRESTYSSVTSSTQDNSAPPVPTLAAEPGFTQGLSNTVSWGAVVDATSGGVNYEVQSATNGAFSAGLVSSGFQAGTSFTFGGLANGQAYFYRVRSRDAMGFMSAFSASVTTTMDNAAPGVPGMTAEPGFTAGTTNAVAWSAAVDAGVGGVEYWVESSRAGGFAIIDASSGWTSALTFTFTRLDDGARYFFHVKSRDALGQESAFSAAVSSVQDAIPPPVPTMVPLAAISQSTFQVPQWGAVTDAGSGGVQYFAEYSTSASFSPVAGNSGFTTNTFWIVMGLTDGTTYYYHVKSRDALLQESGWSTAVFSRQDAAPPTNPAMVAEPSFTAGTSNTVSWSTSTDTGIGGVLYDLQYATNAAFTAGLTNVLGLSGTSTTVSPLTAGTTYFFHVRARDAFGQATAFSAAASSTQDNLPPPVPAMVAEPAFTAGTTNTVSWAAVVDGGVGGVQYLVQASRSATFTVLEDNSGWISLTSFTFTRLDDGVQFFYRVQSRDSLDFQSAFSGVVSSTQDNAAPTVPVIAAEPTYTGGGINSVSWAASADAGVGGVLYQFQYSDTPAFTGVGTVTINSAVSPAVASPLSNGVTYYFHVRASDAFGFTSAWSGVEHSTQDSAGPAVPTMSAEASFTQGSSNTVSWSTVTDAGVGGVQYWVEFSSSSTFASILGNSGWIASTSNTFFGLADGTRYYYHAKARDSFAQESAFSAAVNSQQDATAPTTPVAVALSTYTQGNTVTFSWAASSDTGAGGVEYEAQYAAGAGFSPVLGTSGWISSTSFTFAGLSDGASYSFRVRARDSLANTGGFSAVRSTTMDGSPPSAPLQLTQTPFTPGTSNTVGWAAATDAGVGGIQYQVQYSIFPTFPGFGTTTSAWGVSSPFTASGLTDGFTYYYRVHARDSFLQVSAWSNVEQSTQDNSPPTVPGTLGLPPFIDGSSTTYAWNESFDAGVGGLQYQSQVARDPSFSAVVSTSGWGSERTHVFSGLSDAVVYYYRVRARDAFAFTSSWSSGDAAMTDFLPPPVPAASGLPAFSKGLSVLVAWTSVNDAGVGGVSYEVRAFTSTDTSTAFSASPWTSATTQTMGGLPEGSLVYFAVRSRDALGHQSALSALVSTRPDNSAPPVPTLTALPAYTNGLVVSAAWGGVTDAGVGGVVYRAQLSQDPSFASGVYDSGWVTAMTFSAPPVASGSLVFARVKSADAFSFESPWSALERTIVDNDSPGAPVLQALSPYTEGASVALAWQGVFDAGVGGVTYDAQASTAVDFSVIASESGWIPGTAWQFSGLADGTRYYFRLLARDAFLHNATPSASASTTMDASAPPVPELLVMPAFTAGLQQSVSWNTVADLGVGGVEYAVESSTSASFASGSVSSGWTTAVQFTFAGLADGTRYFYRAHARDAFGHTSNWSLVRNATMDNTAPSVAMGESIVLMDGDSVDLEGAATDAVSGVFSVLFSTDGGANWITATGTDSFVAAVAGLEEGTTTVLVRALDLVGHASALATVEVTVDMSAPTVAFQAPGNGTLVTGLLGIYAVVDDPNFLSFRLQERRVGTGNFTDLVNNGTTARGDNFLGLWDTRALANGLYDLRLTARDALGHTTQRTIQVRLLNSDLSVSYGDLTVSDREPLRGQVVNVTAVVNNYGTASAENVTVTLKDNGAAVFERTGVSIAAHAAYAIDVPYNLSTAGAHAFTLEVSYPEGALDTGLATSTAVVAAEPPVPEPKPFLVEFAGLFSLLSLIALAAIALWAFVQIGRLKRQGPAPAYGAIPDEAVDVEWESDEFL